MRRLFILFAIAIIAQTVKSQDYNELTDDGTFTPARQSGKKDSTHKKQEVPRGMYVWKVDERFGEIIPSVPDTLPHMFPNTLHTSGVRGEYNFLGNLGSPRYSRIFIDQQTPAQFMFTQPYDFFIVQPGKFNFTNTLSPITNLNYSKCGDKNNGEDRLKALFAVNAGKRIGLGFKFDYMYGRGYYQNQSTALFNYTMYGSYLGERYQAHLLLSTNHMKMAENGGITDDEYVAHPESYEDEFNNDEIPTVLSNNWNRNDNQHVFLTHRYSIGFNRKVPMTKQEINAKKFAIAARKEKEAALEREKAEREGRLTDEDYEEQESARPSGRPDDAKIVGKEPVGTDKGGGKDRIKVDSKAMADSLMAKKNKEEEDTSWLKNEFVPVTSFIHTLQFDNYRRIYQAYMTPENYYASTFLDNQKNTGDSIYDEMKHYALKNTLAVSLLEGFNKWAKAGLKLFAASDVRHFSMPDSTNSIINTYNEHSLSVGGQLIKTQGRLLHYNAMLETWFAGKDVGQLKFDANADLNFKLFGDTMRLAAHAHFYRLNPTFFQRNYHSKHLCWDNDNLEKEIRARLEGTLTYEKTRTRLRVAFDDIKNLCYFSQQYTITSTYKRTGNTVSLNQASENISLLTAQLAQDVTFGPLNWESVVTYQKTSNKSLLPVPELNIYTNLYLKFVISKVLHSEVGADLRYFTNYYALDYSPYIGQFAYQNNGDSNVEIGNYPIVNVYANFFLKHARFFVMMTHVNAGEGGRRFYVPHYPLNGMTLRLGVSWNFFN